MSIPPSCSSLSSLWNYLKNSKKKKKTIYFGCVWHSLLPCHSFITMQFLLSLIWHQLFFGSFISFYSVASVVWPFLWLKPSSTPVYEGGTQLWRAAYFAFSNTQIQQKDETAQNNGYTYNGYQYYPYSSDLIDNCSSERSERRTIKIVWKQWRQ